MRGSSKPTWPRFGAHLKSSFTSSLPPCEIHYIGAEESKVVGSDSQMMPVSSACDTGAGSGMLISWNAGLTVEHVNNPDITVTPGRWGPGDTNYAPFGVYRCALLGLRKLCR